MTKHGFYSIVQKRPGEFHIRSRVRQDLENLVQRAPLPGAQVHASDTADYRYRVIVGKDQVLAVMQFLGQTLDYSNFKNTIADTPDQEQKHHLYSKVWGLLSDAFGAYGRDGRLNPSHEE